MAAKGTYKRTREHIERLSRICQAKWDSLTPEQKKERGRRISEGRRRNTLAAIKGAWMQPVEAIAKVCHEANRAYCATIGDNSQPAWEDAPEWQKQSAINGVNFHLTALNAGDKPSPSASHQSWLAEKEREGWKFGPVKDAEKKEHPCFVPYEQLPVEQRLKDYIFSGIVESFHSVA